MAHAKPEHLKGFDILLGEIRKSTLLKEKSFGCFYLKAKGVLHFHIKGERLFAHVYDGKDWFEIDLKPGLTAIKQKAFYKSILRVLSTIQ